MKKLFITLFFFVATICFAQKMKSFNCDIFSFSYPSSFENLPTSKSSTAFQIIGEGAVFLASYWDYDIDDNVSIWDDSIREYAELFETNDYTLVETEKATVLTKSGKRRCLKLKYNVNLYSDGKRIKTKAIIYMMIHQGYFFVFQYLSDGSKPFPTAAADHFMGGLLFKNIKKDSDNKTLNEKNFDSYLSASIKKLNDQLPIEIDECTTHLKVFLIGNTITFKTLVPSDCLNLVDFDLFKETMIENFHVALPKAFFEFLDKKGYSLSYLIYDENDRLRKIIRISNKEILNLN